MLVALLLKEFKVTGHEFKMKVALKIGVGIHGWRFTFWTGTSRSVLSPQLMLSVLFSKTTRRLQATQFISPPYNQSYLIHLFSIFSFCLNSFCFSLFSSLFLPTEIMFVNYCLIFSHIINTSAIDSNNNTRGTKGEPEEEKSRTIEYGYRISRLSHLIWAG